MTMLHEISGDGPVDGSQGIWLDDCAECERRAVTFGLTLVLKGHADRLALPAAQFYGDPAGYEHIVGGLREVFVQMPA